MKPGSPERTSGVLMMLLGFMGLGFQEMQLGFKIIAHPGA
jgi:hypothetical protein